MVQEPWHRELFGDVIKYFKFLVMCVDNMVLFISGAAKIREFIA
jgi:hypothetical protein